MRTVPEYGGRPKAIWRFAKYRPTDIVVYIFNPIKRDAGVKMRNRSGRYGLMISLAAAAVQMELPVEMMLALDLAIVVSLGRHKMVPAWAADRLVARYVPLLSEVFRNEALAVCLYNMDPLKNGKNGIDALREGQLEPVLEELRRIRRDFDLLRDEMPSPATQWAHQTISQP